MKYRNNLSTKFDNSYFDVIKPFKIYIPIGSYNSNTFVGSSCMLGTLYKHVELNVGDKLYDLFGGVFVEINGICYQARMSLSDKHPFEKVYNPALEVFPTENLKEINSPANELKFENKLPTVDVPKKFYGRSIDAII